MALTSNYSQGVQDFQDREYSQVLKRYPTLQRSTFSQQEQYLLYRSLEKLKKTEEAGDVLLSLKAIATGPVQQIIKFEHLQFLAKNKSYTKLLEVISGLPKETNSPYFRRAIRSLLLRSYKNYPDQKHLRKSLGRIMEKFPEFKEDTKILLLLLSSIKKTNPLSKRVLLQLWQKGDVSHIPRSVRKRLDFAMNNPQKHAQVIFQHLMAQKKHKNYTYLRKTLPRYLYFFKSHDHDSFIEVRDLYFSMIYKTRKYSLGERVLNNEASKLFFEFEVATENNWRFAFLIKKKKPTAAFEIRNRLKEMGYMEEAQEMTLKLGNYYYNKDDFLTALGLFNKLNFDSLNAKDLVSTQWKRLMMYNEKNNVKAMLHIAVWAKEFSFPKTQDGAKFCYWTHKLKLIKNMKVKECYERYPFTYYGLKSKELSSPYKQYFAADLVNGLETNKRAFTNDENYLFSFLDLLYATNKASLADNIIKYEAEALKDITWFDHLGGLLQKHKRYYTFHRLVVTNFDELIADEFYGQHFILPLNYPLAFRDKVKAHAEKAKISELLVYAVMREESRFRPYVKSPAGAVGLLQLMPATARYVGRRKRIRGVKRSRLVDPDLNLRLGSAYLNILLKKYDGNPFHTLAAYNGGGTHVKRWRKSVGQKDIDYFVEAITFRETQHYVKKVMKSYYLYQSIYGKNLAAN
ncbi:MAG: lytic transglycosylase domain-containing protein [SAR324 cluster bacterium]|nr:lytic transglycosylase domain-containing protein [SAR324 cluster bacterium]